jgi:hypothetical protein
MFVLPPLDSHAGGGHTAPLQPCFWYEVYLIDRKFRGVETIAEKTCVLIILEKMVNDNKVTA